MRLVGDLRKLRDTALFRVSRLRSVARRSVAPAPASRNQDLQVAYCVIELYTLWHSFSRFLFLSSALGARDGGGVRVTTTVPPPATVDAALTHAIRLRSPSKKKKKPPWRWADEPPWAQPNVLLDSLAAVGASNRPQVSAGLSAPSTVFSGIVPCRNFFAHRGRDTLALFTPIMRNHLISSALRPTDALLSKAIVLGTPRPQPLLLDWIDEVANAIELMI